jgi:fumarate reductase iron-sulfur subunit
MRPDFKGAVALNRVARYAVDPRDQRSDEELYEIVGDDEGVFGCMSLLGCDDTCPKHLPLQSKISYLRRKMVSVK